MIEPGYVGHEFGHALGFMHEMARSDFVDDTKGQCMEGNSSADYLGTPANDRNAIMAATWYCNGNSYLDNWDMVGVQRA